MSTKQTQVRRRGQRIASPTVGLPWCQSALPPTSESGEEIRWRRIVHVKLLGPQQRGHPRVKPELTAVSGREPQWGLPITTTWRLTSESRPPQASSKNPLRHKTLEPVPGTDSSGKMSEVRRRLFTYKPLTWHKPSLQSWGPRR